MSAWSILAKGTFNAAIAIAIDKGLYEEIKSRPADFKAAGQAVLEEAIPVVHEEWKQATEAKMPDAFLRNLVNAQANQYGIATLKRMGLAW